MNCIKAEFELEDHPLMTPLTRLLPPSSYPFTCTQHILLRSHLACLHYHQHQYTTLGGYCSPLAPYEHKNLGHARAFVSSRSTWSGTHTTLNVSQSIAMRRLSVFAKKSPLERSSGSSDSTRSPTDLSHFLMLQKVNYLKAAEQGQARQWTVVMGNEAGGVSFHAPYKHKSSHNYVCYLVRP